MASIDISFSYNGTSPEALGHKCWICADLSRPDSPAPQPGQVFHLSAYGAVIVEAGEDDDILRIKRAFAVIPSAVTRSDAAIKRFITEAISYCHTCSTLLWLVNTKVYRADVCSDGVEIKTDPIYKGNIYGTADVAVQVVSGPLPPAPKPKPAPVPKPQPVTCQAENPVEPDVAEVVEAPQPDSVPDATVVEKDLPKSRKLLIIGVVLGVIAAVVLILCLRGCGSGDTKAPAAEADTVKVVKRLTETIDTVAPVTLPEEKEVADSVPAPAAEKAPEKAPAPKQKAPVPALPADEGSTPDEGDGPVIREGHGSNFTIEPGTQDEE